MNILSAIQIGFQVLSAIAQVEAGVPSPPFKVGNQWYTIQEVAAPATPAA